jgi:hypothetical protein
MGLCIQVTHALNQNLTGGGTFDAMTAATGDTLNIPAFTPNTKARILDVWGGNNTSACEFDLRSPNFHDNIRGLRMASDFNPTLSGADGNPGFLTGQHVLQPLYPSDTIVAEASGTAADKVGLAFLSYYQDLPGCDMQLRTWPQIENRIVNTLGIRVSVSAGASGQYGTAGNFTTTDDRLIANTQYALLGATSQLPATTLAISGPESSNRFLGMPLHWDARWAADYFVFLSKVHNIPAILEFNGSNKAQFLIKVADAATTIATACTIQLAELRS